MTGEKGFTLMEILVAVIILGLAYVAILQNFSTSMRNIVRVEKSRVEVLDDYLALEAEMLPATLETGRDTATPEEKPAYMEGNKFRLVLVASENKRLISLKLEHK